MCVHSVTVITCHDEAAWADLSSSLTTTQMLDIAVVAAHTPWLHMLRAPGQ